MTQTITFEGQKHAFPDDFTEADISAALDSLPKPKGFAQNLGMDARSATKGALGLPGLVYDAAAIPFNLGIAGFNALTDSNVSQIPSAGTQLDRIGDAVGLPKAETDAEKMRSAGVEGVAGALVPAGLAKTAAVETAALARPAIDAVRKAFTTAPVNQAVSGAVGNMAGEGVKQSGGSEGAQLAAVLAGSAGSATGIEATRKALVDSAKRVVSGVQGVTAAERKVVPLLQKMGDGNLDLGIERAMAEVARNPDSALVDVLGMRGERLARVAANVDGPGAELADRFVGERIAGRGDRMQGAADTLAPRSFYQDLEALKTGQREASVPAYEEAFSRPYVWDERLQEFADSPTVREGINKGVRIIRDEDLAAGRKFDPTQYSVTGFNDAGDPIIDKVQSLRLLDAGKRGIDEIINAARDPITGNVQWTQALRAKEAVRKALVDKLDEATTDTATGRSPYADARRAWAEPAQIEDAMWLGRRFLRGDEEVTARKVAQMSPGEREAFQSGVRRELVDTINTNTQTAPAKFSTTKAGLWRRIENIFPAEDVRQFRADTQAELSKMRVEKFINPRVNSQTAPLAQDMKELNVAPDAVPELLLNGATGNVGGIVRALLSPVTKMLGPSKRTAEGLARILMELDPAQQERVMERMRQAPQLRGLRSDLSGDDVKRLAAVLGTYAGANANGQ